MRLETGYAANSRGPATTHTRRYLTTYFGLFQTPKENKKYLGEGATCRPQKSEEYLQRIGPLFSLGAIRERAAGKV
jgi:hypothetical protein